MYTPGLQSKDRVYVYRDPCRQIDISVRVVIVRVVQLWPQDQLFVASQIIQLSNLGGISRNNWPPERFNKIRQRTFPKLVGVAAISARLVYVAQITWPPDNMKCDLLFGLTRRNAPVDTGCDDEKKNKKIKQKNGKFARAISSVNNKARTCGIVYFRSVHKRNVTLGVVQVLILFN